MVTKQRISFSEKLTRKSILKENGCIEWTGKKNFAGYGMIRKDMIENYRTHRLSYEIHIGDIPRNLVVDHICRNRICLNPRHLRLVSPKINALENSLSPSSINHNKTHCIKGHEFTRENTYLAKRKDGRIRRNCKICTRAHQKHYYKK